jgi:hypothetical protein
VVPLGESAVGLNFLDIAIRWIDRYAAERTMKRLARRVAITQRISPHSLGVVLVVTVD